jgi:outer membrane protein assembly factor BamB
MPVSPQTASDPMKRIDRRKERIWLNWRFVMVAGLLLLLLVAMLPIFPALRDRWNQLTSSRSAPPVSQVTPTATPIVSPWWSGHNVDLTIVDGVAYVGSQDGIVSALRTSNGSVLWRYSTGGSSELPEVAGGVVYVATSVDKGAGHVYALRASDGALSWRYTAGSDLFMSTVVNGVVYAGSGESTVFALRASDGSLLWQDKLTGPIDGMVTVVDGVVYAISSHEMVYALRGSDGSLLWQYRLAGHAIASPMIGNGVAYIGLEEGMVYALQADTGSLLWRFTPPGGAFEPPLVIDGVVFVGISEPNPDMASAAHAGYALQISNRSVPGEANKPSKSGIASVYALRAGDGSVLWHDKLNNGGMDNDGTWLMVADGKVYVGTNVNAYAGYVYALQTSNGALLWRYTTEGGVCSALVVNDRVYLCSADGVVSALQTSTGSLLWQYTILGFVFETPVVDGGSVYVGSGNGIAYALRARDGALLWYYLTKVS